MQSITIIGGGAAGMTTAYNLLGAGFEVTLLEARERLGGDRAGVEVAVPGCGVRRVDVGVSELELVTFPRLDEILDQLGVGRSATADDVSFMTLDGETVWSTRPGGAPSGGHRFRWLAEKKRFETEALEVLQSLFYAAFPTERYLDSRGYSREFRDAYLYPRAAGCLAMPGFDPRRFSIRSLVACWSAYGLVGAPRDRRKRIAGGMGGYCEAFARWFSRRGGRLLCSHEVVGVRRGRGRAVVRATGPGGVSSRFESDEVVLAVQPNRAVRLLDDATAAERILAAGFESSRVRAVIHRDRRLMPRDRRSWAAFNYLVRGEGTGRTSITSFACSEPGGSPSAEVFVTFDPRRRPSPDLVLADRTLVIPRPGAAACETARLVRQLQGRRHTWFCGSYLREPFLHEQALESAFDIAERIATGRGTALAKRRDSAAARAAA